jgi:DNA-binding protein HU-beta
MANKELIEKVQAVTELPKKDVQAVVDALTSALITEIVKDGEATLYGFGTFKAVDTAERQGRNLKTGEPLTIPASRKVKFKSAKALKDLL